jgi:hypothetical protein
VVQVCAEVTGGRKCCLSSKVGRNFVQTEPWNMEDGTGLVTIQQEPQLTTIKQSKNSQNCRRLNKTHCGYLIKYINLHGLISILYGIRRY